MVGAGALLAGPILPNAREKDPAMPPSPSPRWWTFGLLNVAVIAVVSLSGWYLLADPRTSPLGVYPLPFNTALFWALMFVVWLGFNLEMSWFSRLPQPLCGIAFTAATIGGGVAVTWLLSRGLGSVNPDFDPSGPLGLSAYFVAALFVLFGFSTYIMSVVNWGHWPVAGAMTGQPYVGLGSIALLMVPTILLWAVLGIPAVAHPESAVMGVPTLLGWYYSLIIAIVLTGVVGENWPWRLAGTGARLALAATAGNVVLGTVLYVGLREVAHLLVGSTNAAALGAGINLYPAELGVCWVVWMILWANVFGNKPVGLGDAASLAIRAVVTFGLACGTFVAYYFVLAEHVLHEPAIAHTSLAGDALGFMDWVALVALLYIVGFGSWGLHAPSADQPTEALPVDHPTAHAAGQN